MRLQTTSATFAILLACSRLVCAEPQYEVLHAFAGIAGKPKAHLLEASDGSIYGLTTKGGRGGGGLIFAVRLTGANLAFRVVHEFASVDGAEPVAGLIEVNGELYGTTSAKGTGGVGTVFKIDHQGDFVLLHTFTGPDGARPLAALVHAADGALYGTTSEGGAHGFGTVFRITPTGTLTTLHSFAGVDGATPQTALVEGTDGNLYGMTSGVSESAGGRTVFRMSTAGTLTTLYTFTLLSGDPLLQGKPSIGLVRGPDGNLYGGVSRGFPFYDSSTTFFRITLEGVVTPLYATDATQGYTLVEPVSMSLGSDGNFYGTLPIGGPYAMGSSDGAGTAYRLTSSGNFTVLHTFTPEEGSSVSGLTEARGAGLLGVTVNGGIASHGILFRLSGNGRLTQLRHFTGVDGEAPWAAPARGADGAYYGTTVKGGLFDRGTIYRVSPEGTVQTVHVFSGPDGAYPYAGLVMGNDGFLYGAATQGGCSGRGVVFRLTAAVFQVLHCFQGTEGSFPFATLIKGSDGHFYGTTVAGGARDEGTLFGITAAGLFATLQSFDSQPVLARHFGVAYPYGTLVEIADGTLYGTGANPPQSFDGGTVYSFSSSSGLTRIHAFEGEINGGFPPTIDPGPQVFAGLARADDGYLYGITESGLLFRHLPGSGPGVEELATVPGAGLSAWIQSTDGSLYGTTVTSGETGMLHRRDPGGTVTALRIFAADDGPPIALVEAPDGSLIGTTHDAGPAGGGTLFRFTP